MFHGVAQTEYQPVATAKSNKAVKKSLWFAAPINGLFCIIPALIGLAAFAIVAYNKHGSMMMTPMMLVDLLPKPVLGLFIAGFLGVDLSSFAVMALAPATIISNDMYTLYEKDATEKQKTRLSRMCIVIIGVVSVLVCNFQPAVVDMVNWSFSFGVPIFVMAIIGLWWKISEKSAIITFAVTWIVVCIWSTVGLQEYLQLANFHVTYIALIVSLLVGCITTAMLPGKPGLFVKERKLQKVAH